MHTYQTILTVICREKCDVYALHVYIRFLYLNVDRIQINQLHKTKQKWKHKRTPPSSLYNNSIDENNSGESLRN